MTGVERATVLYALLVGSLAVNAAFYGQQGNDTFAGEIVIGIVTAFLLYPITKLVKYMFQKSGPEVALDHNLIVSCHHQQALMRCPPPLCAPLCMCGAVRWCCVGSAVVPGFRSCSFICQTHLISRCQGINTDYVGLNRAQRLFKARKKKRDRRRRAKLRKKVEDAGGSFPNALTPVASSGATKNATVHQNLVSAGTVRSDQDNGRQSPGHATGYVIQQQVPTASDEGEDGTNRKSKQNRQSSSSVRSWGKQMSFRIKTSLLGTKKHEHSKVTTPCTNRELNLCRCYG